MQNIATGERISKVDSFNGIDVYKISLEKFKTNTINIFFYDHMSRENAAKNAMVPAVLRRGCEGYGTFKEIALYLEELYGATFDCGITKKGEMQIIQFYIEFISDRYTAEKESLFQKNLELLEKILTKPLLEDGGFKKGYVDQEKENLKNLIEGRVNDKMQYAVEKCMEEMCKDEPYGINEYGSVEDLRDIDSQNLSNQYRYMLETLPASVFVTGDIDDEKIGLLLDTLKRIKRGHIKEIKNSSIRGVSGEVKQITEKMDVNQGKLTLGFRTNTAPDDRDYYPLLVYNGVLGGGVHSKLFQNVREKESLAYYIFSRLEKFKGLMVVSSGIELENRDKTLDIIKEQLEDMKSGRISEYEYRSTLKSIETGINSLKDSQIHIVDFYLSQLLTGTNENLDTILQKVKGVTLEDVAQVAKKVELDTVYFLTAK